MRNEYEVVRYLTLPLSHAPTRRQVYLASEDLHLTGLGLYRRGVRNPGARWVSKQCWQEHLLPSQTATSAEVASNMCGSQQQHEQKCLQVLDTPAWQLRQCNKNGVVTDRVCQTACQVAEGGRLTFFSEISIAGHTAMFVETNDINERRVMLEEYLAMARS